MKPLKQCRILVTPTSYAKNNLDLRTELEAQVGEVVYNPFGRPLVSAELVPLIPGIDGYIAGLDEIDQSVIQVADCLKVIARYGNWLAVNLARAWPTKCESCTVAASNRKTSVV